jgi:hypothetical protein
VPPLCLSIHADYACRHTGACCDSWFVPADAHVVELVRSGRLAVTTPDPVFLSRPGAAGGSIDRIAHGPGGSCVFRQDERCSIHAQAGPAALPVSCRHYPRVILRDDSGTRVSLSHYCPTAASLLLTPCELEVMPAPPGLIVDEPVEGLDARDTLPPLIRPGMLTDLDGYHAWEDACIATLSRRDVTGALGVIGTATETVRAWTPSSGPLADAVARAFASAERTASMEDSAYARAGREIVQALSNQAHEIPGTHGERLAAELERAISHYLAARLFGNWLCYQGRGLRTIVAWLHACHDAVRGLVAPQTTTAQDLVSAIRSTDFLMLHTIDSQAFADAAVGLEQ